MGRHSRRGAAPKGDSVDTNAQGETRGAAPAAGREAEGREVRLPGQRQAPAGGPGAQGAPPRPAPGTPAFPPGTAPRGVRRFPDGTPAQGMPRLPDGTPAQGVPRLPGFPDGTPAHGVPRFPNGTPAQGVPRFPDGTPAHGVPRLPDGTPARGVPRLPDGTPAQGVPRVGGGAFRARGGHPEQREAGGGWGEFKGAAGDAGTAPGGRPGAPGGPAASAAAGVRRGPAGPGAALPRQRRKGGPRQDYLDAFDEDIDVFEPGSGRRADQGGGQGPHNSDTDRAAAGAGSGPGGDGPETAVPAPRSGGRSRTFTGIAAAAVTTALAIVVAGQVADGHEDSGVQARSTAGRSGDAAPGGTAPGAAPHVAALTYDQKMARTYPLSAKLKGSGKFDAVPGLDRAPGKGQKYTYRVDVEQGLDLDGALFAEAVQKTLNDDRSWAHDGARTFERVSSGKPDFVITLASPGTTAEWCAKSGLDTTEDNVSCDSASTERVMINAYRWAQGSETYGDKIHAYRQMLINHEVGHRLGHGHVTCDKDGELAPVMQQQTKFLDHDGIHCRPNPWPYPRS
ncbi:DUF3152 domain-containing protein [Streptomyces sp. NPDC001835]|uniref:DUF3152 domain-containing protein n=1 Tax=Streptomyces sp. NPDC001835 TaxID=3154528 RepID=UPI00332D5082